MMHNKNRAIAFLCQLAVSNKGDLEVLHHAAVLKAKISKVRHMLFGIRVIAVAPSYVGGKSVAGKLLLTVTDPVDFDSTADILELFAA